MVLGAISVLIIPVEFDPLLYIYFHLPGDKRQAPWMPF